MRVRPVILAFVLAALPLPADDAVAPAERATRSEAHDDVGNYARWVGSPKAALVAFWGQPHKVKSKRDQTVLIYELRVTCDGIITGTHFTSIGKGVVSGSQDPLDGIENNVPQGASRRAGMRVAARQTVRFFVDEAGVVSHHEASNPKTNWNRCQY